MAKPSYTFGEGNAPGPQQQEEAAPGLDWRDYVSILMERIWIAITVLVIAVVLTYLHVQSQTPMYRSHCRIQIEDRNSSVVTVQEVLYMNQNSIESFRTHVMNLSSRQLIGKVLEQDGLGNNPTFMSQNLERDVAIDVALGYLSIQPVKNSKLIDVVVQHPVPELAARFADAVAEEYLRQDREIRLSKSVELVEWIREKSDEYREKLENGMLTLQQYREDQNAISLEERQNVVVAKLMTLSGSLTAAENATHASRAEWDAVQAIGDNVEALSELPGVAGDSDVRNAYSILKAKRNALEVLRKTYLHKHPKLQAAEDEVGVLTLAFHKACFAAAARIEARYRAAEAEEKSFAASLKTQETAAFDLDRKLVMYQQLKLSVDADREVYEGMLSRIREASMAGDMQISLLRLMDPARVPTRPAFPNPQKTLRTGVLMGLVLGIGLSFGAHFLDNRLRRVEEVEALFGLPVLAAIPHIRKGSESERRRIAELEPRSGPAEAFRTMRACLSLQPIGKKAKTILITSVSPSEGKSLTASNLAVVFAHDNERTLLIDADMRRPTAHSAFEFDGPVPEKGLSHVLSGKAPWSELVMPTSTNNLDILLAGEIPLNPSELLGSPMMTTLLEEVEQKYDRIILDSPPVMGVSDPLVMSSRADGIVFVLHFGKTRKRAAKMCLQQLRVAGTPILGLVLDNVRARGGGSYYYYHHSEGYGNLPGSNASSKT